MKVLFAVSNENISTQIVRKYQKEYKEIISYKNMYYFNAIIKELQRDKSYDRIVVSEDLEPFANNNSDSIEKFIFEKLDNISDEATQLDGTDIPIILLANDKRTKSEPLLVKLFGIGIYNILLGQDRSTDNVCALLNKPRSKKEAKLYYKIEADEVNYKSENENNVSETEIKNILNHYRKLGKDEERYVESFNNIAAQYNDAQLRIITKFLPLNVKAVLEEQSPKYQSVMTFSDTSTTELMKKKEEEDGLKVGFLNYTNTNKPSEPVIVPTAVKKVAIKKNVNTNSSIENEFKEPDIVEPIKRGRGRPKKIVETIKEEGFNEVKRGRGRPKKVSENTIDTKENSNFKAYNSDIEEKKLPGFEEAEDTILPGFDDVEDISTTTDGEFNKTLPGFDDVEEDNNILPGFDDVEEDNNILPGFDNVEEDNNILPGFDDVEKEEKRLTNFNTMNNVERTYSATETVSTFLSLNKKIVSFIGTTKNGTSFLVNNLAKCLSSMGIRTAILDLTSNRNSYYIYTKNEEKLRNIAYESIKKLKNGIANGVPVDRNLDVYTALPGDRLPLEYRNEILSTLADKYSIILLDCDFNTPAEYFEAAQEIYIVQNMDILTIQPMTAFLRDLKAKDMLEAEKIRIIINKEMKVKGLTSKTIIGGLAYYNDPAMSFMTELFNKDTVKYITIPFDGEACSKYLEGVMNCEITINGYSKIFNMKLRDLANMVYPLIGNKNKSLGDYSANRKFSTNMNNTLEQMKNRY